jgi:hypothetical protein
MIKTMKPDMIFGDISRLVNKANDTSVAEAREEMDNVELIYQIYLEAMNGKSTAAEQVRKFYDNWTGEEKLAKKRIKMLCWSYCSNFMKNIKNRRQLMIDNHETIVQNTISKPFISPAHILMGYNLTEDEKILALWKMDLIEEDDAKKILEVRSSKTLYNRWDKLKAKLKATIGGN